LYVIHVKEVRLVGIAHKIMTQTLKFNKLTKPTVSELNLVLISL